MNLRMTSRRVNARNTPKAISSERAPIAMLLFLILLLAVSRSYSQTEEQKNIKNTTVYLTFFHYHVSDVQRRASMSGEQRSVAVEDRAALLNITVQDLKLLDEVSTTFVGQEKALAVENLEYERQRREAGQPIDPAVLHSFTVRREQLASSAMSRLRANFSASSFEGFERFLDTDFRKSLHPVKVR